MKTNKFVILILVFIVLIVIFTGCNNKNTSQEQEDSLFIVIESSYSYKIVYNRETRVMYAVSTGVYNYGNFTVLVNEDGTPQIYNK